jgi:putative membrane protein
MRHLHSGLLLSLSILCLSAPGWAQSSGNPAGNNPAAQQSAPGKPAPHELNMPDRVFLRAAAAGGLAEVDVGQLAASAGENDLIKSFAQRMVSDHGKANKKLSTLADASQFPLPDKPDAEQRRKRAELEKMKGAAFDRAYIVGQLQDHQRTAQLLEYEIDSGQNADLKAFAEDTLPVVLEHLQMAQDIATKLWGVAPQGAAPGLAALHP